MNLVSNAIKYSPDGATVKIDSEIADDGTLRISVIDTGKGMDENELPRIFNRHYRIQNASTEVVTGAGIGLALVKELVDSHGGQIKVASVKGEGSTFTVILPKNRIAFEVEQSQAVNNELIEMELDNTEVWESTIPAAEVKQEGTEPEAPQGKPTLLIVEDNRDLQQFIKGCLEQHYHCYVADDGDKGLEVALDKQPDLVISDIMMPGKNGFELCEALKNDDRTSHIPVLLLTARNDQASRMEGWKNLADEYMTKPFDERELLIRVDNLLAIRTILSQRLGEQVLEQPNTKLVSKPGLNERDRKFVEQFVKVVEDNLHIPTFNIDQMASQVAMSERQLQRKLKAVLDLSPVEYIRNVRLKKSRELLLEGKRVADVAELVGFSSNSYFTRCFRAKFEMTPKEFQQSHDV